MNQQEIDLARDARDMIRAAFALLNEGAARDRLQDFEMAQRSLADAYRTLKAIAESEPEPSPTGLDALVRHWDKRPTA